MEEALFSRDMTAKMNWAMGQIISRLPGHRIMTAGMSFLQTVGRGANIHLWAPTDGKGVFSPEKFDAAPPYEWLIVRQIEIMHENANNLMDRLDINNMWDMYKSFSLMRAGGVRVAIIAAGHFDKESIESNVDAFDRDFHAKLRSMEHMLWLDEFNKNTRQMLKENPIRIDDFLPHVVTSLLEENLIGRKNLDSYKRAGAFMERVRQVPLRHRSTDYDINVGLRTPKNANNNVQTFQMLPENTYSAIMPFIRSFFGTFGIDQQPGVMHMRSYGDHVRGKAIMNYKAKLAMNSHKLTLR